MPEANEDPMSNDDFISYLGQLLLKLKELKTGLQEKKLAEEFVIKEVHKYLNELKNENILNQETKVRNLLLNWRPRLEKGEKLSDLILEPSKILIEEAVAFLKKVTGRPSDVIRGWLDTPDFKLSDLEIHFTSLNLKDIEQIDKKLLSLQVKLEWYNRLARESMVALEDLMMIQRGRDQIKYYEAKVKKELAYIRLVPGSFKSIYYYFSFYISIKLNLLEPILTEAKFFSKDGVQLLVFIVGLIIVDVVLDKLLLSRLRRNFLFHSIVNCIKIAEIKLDAFANLGPFLG